MYASILDYRYNKQKANSKADWDGKKIKKQKETYGNKTPKRIGLGDVKNLQKQIIFRLDTNIIKALQGSLAGQMYDMLINSIDTYIPILQIHIEF